MFYSGPEQPKMQDFCSSAVPKAVKLATKVNFSVLGLCCVRATTVHRYHRLLHLIAPVVFS